jgi:hypothetical protein
MSATPKSSIASGASHPPKTVDDYHAHWSADGTVNHLCSRLRVQVRQAAVPWPEPTTAIIDSQSVRATETVVPAMIRNVPVPRPKTPS